MKKRDLIGWVNSGDGGDFEEGFGIVVSETIVRQVRQLGSRGGIGLGGFAVEGGFAVAGSHSQSRGFAVACGFPSGFAVAAAFQSLPH